MPIVMVGMRIGPRCHSGRSVPVSTGCDIDPGTPGSTQNVKGCEQSEARKNRRNAASMNSHKNGPCDETDLEPILKVSGMPRKGSCRTVQRAEGARCGVAPSNRSDTGDGVPGQPDLQIDRSPSLSKLEIFGAARRNWWGYHSVHLTPTHADDWVGIERSFQKRA